jgi:glycosyltransferase involved in cell wall biosynthesis
VNLLFVSGEYPPDIGGVGDYTARLRAELAARGQPSRLLSRRDVGRWDARAFVALLRAAPRTGVVHVQYQAGAFDLLGDVCLMPRLLRLTRPKVRVFTTFHDARVPYLFPQAGRLRPAAIQRLARDSAVVFAADSRDLRVLAGPGHAAWQVPIGPNVECAPPAGYDRAAFRASLGVAPTSLVVAYFGLLNASKGLDLLLATFEEIRAGRPETTLLLLGGEIGASDPTDRATAARVSGWLAARPELAAAIVRPGWLAPSDLSAYLLAADVALLPYADGASPRRGSLLACAAHGLPIVSTAPVAPEVADAVRAPTAPGPGVPPATAPALAATVLEVAAAPEPWRRGSHALAARTTWARIAAQHLALYASS